MPMNQFASQKEVLFVCYDDIIKTSKLYILKKLLTDEYKPFYKTFIDYSKIEDRSDEEIMGAIIASTKINILEYLAIAPFDYENTYIELYLRYNDIIPTAKLLSFGESIHVLLKQSFTQRIFIYTKYNDDNIRKDLNLIYGNNIVSYVYGNFKETVEAVSKGNKITSFVLNDINMLNDLIEMDKVAYTNILVANYGWQYKLNDDGFPVLKIDDIDNLSKEKVFKLGMFNPDNKAQFK